MVEKVVVINTGMVGILQTPNGAGPVVERCSIRGW